MEVVGLDHVQLAMPAGQEDVARRFYVGLLGLTEVTKPAGLVGRGGCWFVGPSIHLHLGGDPAFVPAAKAHPGLLVANLEAARRTLDEAGVQVVDDEAIEVERFYASDPFGNRLEFIAAGDRGFTERARTSP